MPQIMCPNCGTTINLENRRKIDFGIIKEATEKSPKTFTELLHATRLSRKTLNLRLKELCMEGVLVKEEGCYRLNGSLLARHEGEGFVRGLSGILHNGKIRTGMMLLALLAFSSASGYVLATHFQPPQSQNQKPTIMGSFSMELNIVGVKDLYAWQAVIIYDPSEFKVLEVLPGDFLGIEYPYFVSATDVINNGLFLGGTLSGEVQGIDGSGKLATITFGYFADNYNEKPTLVLKQGFLETKIVDSNGSPIDLNESTMLALIS